MTEPSRFARYGAVRGVALGYLALLLAIPLVMIFVKTFEDGIREPLDSITSLEGSTPSG